MVARFALCPDTIQRLMSVWEMCSVKDTYAQSLLCDESIANRHTRYTRPLIYAQCQLKCGVGNKKATLAIQDHQILKKLKVRWYSHEFRCQEWNHKVVSGFNPRQ